MSSGETSDLMTEDEFERLLDELHGSHPGASAAATPLVTTPGTATSVVVSSLAIDDLEEPLSAIRVALHESREVCLDLTPLERFDTAGIQLLAASHRQADCMHKELRIHAPPERLIEALSELGLGHACGLAS